jgi:membrane protein required for colicin V production
LTILDLVIIIVVAIGFVLGYKDGLIRKIVGLAGFILAVYLSLKYAQEIGKLIESILGIEYYLSRIIGGMIIFFTILIITAALKRIVHPFDSLNNVINQVLGGVIGVIQILFFIGAVLFLLNVFNIPEKESREKSLFYNKVSNVIPLTIDYMSDYTPETKKVIKDYINDKDSTQQ